MSFLFPYYIVRFKHIPAQIYRMSFLGFHTTQYDLNRYYEERECGTWESFHTTQYDLNQKPISTQEERDEFPYYIVRFKPAEKAAFTPKIKRFHTTQYDLNKMSIPISFTSRGGFHTTQYDLNRDASRGIFCSFEVSILHSTI